MVKFLMSVTCEGDFKFEEGKCYEYVENSDNEANKQFIFVKQPNSPKDKNWYCKVARIHEGKIFEFVD